ncbi:sigma-70 family RNA polymerase sigma factor [Amycolatopsis sp. GM8]|uniref:sigma-70 family RNA polymerase sigma factor n=1 Tax=Amycolatopsis sp. GM8 TaxID=2896530 RepID=UPI001F375641|nr:sigma-70 family RNA polymerase sigma factor [Amycolatopsis sp. GM8]
MAERHELIRAHLPLVHDWVRTLAPGLPAYADIEEITAAGVYALVVSAELFRARQGRSFSRFAQPRLERAIRTAAAQESRRFMTDARPKAPAPYEVDVEPLTSQDIAGWLSDTAPGPEEIVLSRERLRVVRMEIDRLPDRLRMIFTSRFMQQRRIAEIAVELGLSDSRVFQLSVQAVERLRDRLEARERL